MFFSGTGASETDLVVAAQQTQTPTLTRRVADLVFNSTSFSLLSLIGIPIALAAGYWLFVVNGPTPVVRAREGEGGRSSGGHYEEEGGSSMAGAVMEAILMAIVGREAEYLQ